MLYYDFGNYAMDMAMKYDFLLNSTDVYYKQDPYKFKVQVDKKNSFLNLYFERNKKNSDFNMLPWFMLLEAPVLDVNSYKKLGEKVMKLKNKYPFLFKETLVYGMDLPFSCFEDSHFLFKNIPILIKTELMSEADVIQNNTFCGCHFREGCCLHVDQCKRILVDPKWIGLPFIKDNKILPVYTILEDKLVKLNDIEDKVDITEEKKEKEILLDVKKEEFYTKGEYEIQDGDKVQIQGEIPYYKKNTYSVEDFTKNQMIPIVLKYKKSEIDRSYKKRKERPNSKIPLKDDMNYLVKLLGSPLLKWRFDQEKCEQGGNPVVNDYVNDLPFVWIDKYNLVNDVNRSYIKNFVFEPIPYKDDKKLPSRVEGTTPKKKIFNLSFDVEKFKQINPDKYNDFLNKQELVKKLGGFYLINYRKAFNRGDLKKLKEIERLAESSEQVRLAKLKKKLEEQEDDDIKAKKWKEYTKNQEKVKKQKQQEIKEQEIKKKQNYDREHNYLGLKRYRPKLQIIDVEDLEKDTDKQKVREYLEELLLEDETEPLPKSKYMSDNYELWDIIDKKREMQRAKKQREELDTINYFLDNEDELIKADELAMDKFVDDVEEEVFARRMKNLELDEVNRVANKPQNQQA